MTQPRHKKYADALHAIAMALDHPRNRYGKLDIRDWSTNDALQNLARKYKVGPANDSIEQAVLVARAVLLDS